MLFSDAGVPSGHWLFPMITLGIFLLLLLTLFIISYLNHHDYRDLIEDEVKKTQGEG